MLTQNFGLTNHFLLIKSFLNIFYLRDNKNSVATDEDRREETDVHRPSSRPTRVDGSTGLGSTSADVPRTERLRVTAASQFFSG